MAWLLHQQTEGFGVVPMRVEPSAEQRRIAPDWYLRQGLSFLPEGPAKSGLALPDFAWPSRAQLKTKRKTLPDILGLGNFIAVSEAVKDMVELFEPGFHNFRKVQIIQEDGADYPVQYYAFHCRRRFDQIVIWDESQVYSRDNGRGPRFRIPYSSERVVIDKAQVGDAHVWTMTEMIGGITVVSEQLYSSLNESKLLRGQESIQLIEQ